MYVSVREVTKVRGKWLVNNTCVEYHNLVSHWLCVFVYIIQPVHYCNL